MSLGAMDLVHILSFVLGVWFGIRRARFLSCLYSLYVMENKTTETHTK